MRFSIALAAVASLAGCSLFSEVDPPSQPVPETYEQYVALRAELIEDLDRAIGEALASTPTACRVVAVGQKACGGPWEYRVYSASTADEAAIASRADAVTRLDADANARLGLASDCSIAARPTPVLTDGRCRAAERP
jgi:hypothetical protein